MPEPVAAPAAPWVLRLYPRAWRARYGDELAALLEGQPISFAMHLDLLGGALDARLSPQKTTQNLGAEKMNARLLTCCSSGQPKLTVRQSLIGAGAMLLVTFLLTAAHLWLEKVYGPLPAVDALQHSAFPILLLMMTNTLYLQQRSWRAQAAFVLFFAAILYLILLAATTPW